LTGETFPFTGRGTDGPKREARRAENGDGVLGRGSEPLAAPSQEHHPCEPTLHQLGVWGSVISSPNLKFGAT